MSRLHLIAAAVGALIIALTASTTFYGVKFKRTEKLYLRERDERERLEEELKRTRAKLAETEAELSAKINEVRILNQALEDLKGKVRELDEEKARIEAEKQRQIQELQKLKEKLQKELRAKEITISELRGRLTVNVMGKVLFEPGSAELKPEGKEVLRRIAELLNKFPNRRIRVEGHTDNLPISPRLRDKYPTNWELSAARAIAAVRFLQEQCGVDPRRLAAAAYSQYRPIADNSTPEGRAKNRRIEIVLLPPEPEVRR
ncbi:chemotaxis protein MotB [Candidatus Poribacteria bacterium]|nr:MAG: chemotaxis protein MotB [Candidatus Poribacteria bacterium]